MNATLRDSRRGCASTDSSGGHSPRAIVVPCLLMTEIDKGTEHKAKSRKTCRCGNVAYHHVVRGEVHDGRNGPEGDGLGQRPTDLYRVLADQPTLRDAHRLRQREIDTGVSRRT